MGLAEQQALLARIYTDAQVRDQFFADPVRIGAAWGLSEDEARRLAQLPLPQVGRFAGSLHGKRLNEARKLLPGTHQLLGNRFAGLFHHHVSAQTSPGAGMYRQDAIFFVTFIEQVARTESLEPWIVDVARYEAAELQIRHSAGCCLMRLLRYPAHDFVRELGGEHEVAPPAARPTLIIWLRFMPRGRLRRMALSLPSVPRSFAQRLR